MSKNSSKKHSSADAVDFSVKSNLPAIGDLVGPALQQEIAAVNKAVLSLVVTAARMGEAEPLGPALLGISREALNALGFCGHADLLLAQAQGLPLVELRIKDPGTFHTIVKSGYGSPEAIAAITKSMPLELITKAGKKV